MKASELAPISGVVVAGGNSSRLGSDKRRLRLWGTQGPALLEHVVRTIDPLCDEVLVVLNDPQGWEQLPARLVPDALPGTGVLGGVYSGLLAARHAHVLVVAADMPFLNPALLRAMLVEPRDYDVLIPRAPAAPQGTLEPLHGVYAHACHAALRAQLDAGERRITHCLAKLRTVVFPADAVRRHDPHGWSFVNVNTPADLQRARAHAAASFTNE